MAQIHTYQCPNCGTVAVTAAKATERPWRCNLCPSWLRYVDSREAVTAQERGWLARGLVYNPGIEGRTAEIHRETDGRISDVLAGSPGLSVTEIRASTSMLRAQILASLLRLQSRGVVYELRGTGQWFPVPATTRKVG
jgi:hypothetical protein